MAEIVNLRRVHKHKARGAQDALATENRIKFGRTRAERQLAEARRDQATRAVEAHRLDGSDET